jgi:hypothetical protein
MSTVLAVDSCAGVYRCHAGVLKHCRRIPLHILSVTIPACTLPRCLALLLEHAEGAGDNAWVTMTPTSNASQVTPLPELLSQQQGLIMLVGHLGVRKQSKQEI